MMGKVFHPVHSPWILRRMMSRRIHWQGRPDKDVIYLTFDDGPVPDATPAVLDILDQFDARATFFCVGDNVRKYPDLYERLLREGHSTGNHSFAHLNGWKTPTDVYVRDVEKAGELIQGSLFRPPYGRIRSAQSRKLAGDFHIVLWSVLSWDFHPDVEAGECLENVRDHSRAGSIVVFHDSPRCITKLNYVLPRYLEEFRRKGFTFEPLTPECLDTE